MPTPGTPAKELFLHWLVPGFCVEMNGFQAALGVIGGLGLFLYGMELVTKGLQRTLALRLRSFLLRVTENRVLAFFGGATIATLIFSGPATAMVTGFVNAGLISLVQAIPLIIGANVGTTLTMQFVSLHPVAVAPAAIGLGIIMRLFFRSEVVRNAGSTPLGFGLLFLGLEFLQGALEPLRESQPIRDFLAGIGSQTLIGLVLGVLASGLLTSVLMSSSATIAITFSLVKVGIVTSLDQAFPILLGAHIGTCIITIISALGKTTDAKRAALCHLLFNIFGSVLALILMRVYLRVIPMTSGDLVRQIANMHTIIQLVNAISFLPAVALFASLATRILPSRNGDSEERTHLDPRLVDTPDIAIMLATREMQRQTRICLTMLQKTLIGLRGGQQLPIDEVRSQERAVDDIKHALDGYLVMIAERQLSRRHAIQLQELVATCNDIERIADHIEDIILMTRTRERKQVKFDAEHESCLQELGALVSDILSLTVASLDVKLPQENFAIAQSILDRRKVYKRRAGEIKQLFNEQIEEGSTDGMQGIFFMRYVMEFDRIIRHVRGIARAEVRQALSSGESTTELNLPSQLA